MKIEQQNFTSDGRWLPEAAPCASACVEDMLWSQRITRLFAEKGDRAPTMMLPRLPSLDWPPNLFA